MTNSTSFRRLPLFPFFLLFFLLSPASPGIAQESSGDSLVDRRDNPLGRAEFERERRADPSTGRIPTGIRKEELRFAATLPGAIGNDRAEKSLPTTASGEILWIERGPSDQGGRTRALAVDRSDENVILAGGVSGGVWRSTDRGESWTRMTALDQIHSVTTLVQDPRPGSQHIWYYGTGETRANSAGLPGDGIYRSTDRGLTWEGLAWTIRATPQERDQIFDYVHRIVVDPSSIEEDRVYAACYGGIARSTNGGETWSEVLGGFANRAGYTDIAVSSTGVLYATLSSDGGAIEGIWRSVNGVDWVEITPAGFPRMFGRIVPAIAPSREDLVYFFARTPTTGQNGHSLWVYDHNQGNGATWEDRSTGLRYNTETYSNYCQTIAVAPWDEDVVFLGHIRMQRTTDGFRDSLNLVNQTAGGQHNDQHEIVFFPSDPRQMLAGHDGGVSYAPDNSSSSITWQFRNRGYTTTQFYSIAIDQSATGPSPVIGGTQDNGTWMLSDGGLTEGRKIFGADGGYCAVADGGTDYYTSYQNGQIFRSQFDSLGNRTAWGRVDPIGGDSYAFIHPFTLDRADTRIMYLPEGSKLWRNSDLTEIPLSNRSVKTSVNWEVMEGVVPQAGGRFSALATSTANPPHRLYLGSNNGELVRVDSSAGESPVVTAIPIQGGRGFVNSIAVNPADGADALVAFSNYNVESIYHTTDGGETWEAVSGNLEEEPGGAGNGPSVSWVSMLPVNGLMIYFAGTTTGLYSTTFLDGEKTVWKQEGATTIGNVVVDMMATRSTDGMVAVGTHGRGIFTGNAFQALVPAHLTISDGTLVFDTVNVGEGRRETFTITCRADSERPITGVIDIVEGPFEIDGGARRFSLAPGYSEQVGVRFVPERNGLVGGKVEVRHDGNTPSGRQTIYLVGVGAGASSTPDRDEVTAEEVPRILVSPSRVRNEAAIRLNLIRGGLYSVEVVDAVGRVIPVATDQRFGDGEKLLRIDATSLPAGAYTVRLLSAAGTIGTTRFIVER